MQKSEKSFDAVLMMRQIRDKLSAQCKEMTFEEQKRYIRERLSGKPTKEKPVTNNATPQRRAGLKTALEATGHSTGFFPIRGSVGLWPAPQPGRSAHKKNGRTGLTNSGMDGDRALR
jgi:hypothetical protein